MIEVELKFEIKKEKIEGLVSQLKKLGFTASKRIYEKTVMYDNPQQLMQTTDGRVRLRVTGDKCEFCYKKPLTREGVKKEIEHEVVVSDFDTTEKILGAMEFTSTTSYERYRTTLTNKVKVTIDEYPFATFLEIEGEEDEIKKVAGELKLDLKGNLTDPCDTLFQKWRKERGLGFKPQLLFKDYDK